MDTNILIYAYDRDSDHFTTASDLLKGLVEGQQPWVLPWPCIYEFLRVITHPKILARPVPIREAWADLVPIISSPSLIWLSETSRHQDIFASLIRKMAIAGNLVHDAHIATLLIEHGVREIVTADEDFRRFEGLIVTNPFR